MISVYDRIGIGYSGGRREDPRIRDPILRAVGPSRSIVNVGAGSGSYEPADRMVTSVEPSITMIRQRRNPSSRVVQGRAERLPFPDGVFDCALAVLTIHHWSPAAAGLAEMRRVARDRVVILTFDQNVWETFWLFDYCPNLCAPERSRAVPIAEITATLGRSTVLPVPIPHDCVDGFQGAFWRRPEAYLDARVRGRMSSFAQAPRECYQDGLARLGADLASGAWRNKYAGLLNRESADLGYRLVVAEYGLNQVCKGLAELIEPGVAEDEDRG